MNISSQARRKLILLFDRALRVSLRPKVVEYVQNNIFFWIIWIFLSRNLVWLLALRKHVHHHHPLQQQQALNDKHPPSIEVSNSIIFNWLKLQYKVFQSRWISWTAVSRVWVKIKMMTMNLMTVAAALAIITTTITNQRRRIYKIQTWFPRYQHRHCYQRDIIQSNATKASTFVSVTIDFFVWFIYLFIKKIMNSDVG